jgi:dTDP-4-amino-4,6-dideoxygalactose transaminase
MVDMAPVLSLAERHGATVVEDAACALGASMGGRSAGAWGEAGCFSFHPRKVVTTGEGGMVTTDDASVASRLRALRNHGIGGQSREFVAAGFNYRMTEFQGALGGSQLGRLDWLLERRRKLAERYAVLLQGLNLVLPVAAEPHASTFQSYVVLLPQELAGGRASLIARMREAGVEVTIGTHHIPLTDYFRRHGRYKAGDFPVTDQVAARALALPMHQDLEEHEQDLVVETLRETLTSA